VLTNWEIPVGGSSNLPSPTILFFHGGLGTGKYRVAGSEVRISLPPPFYFFMEVSEPGNIG